MIALCVAAMHPGTAAAKRRVQPIARSPAPSPEVVAPEHSTIPEDLVVPARTPEPRPAPETATPAVEDPSAAPEAAIEDGAAALAIEPEEATASGTKTVEGDNTEYVIDVSSEATLDADVLAAQAAPPPDPAVLQRRSTAFLGVGVPILTLGLAAIAGGSAIGSMDDRLEVEHRVWVPLMLGGVVLVAIGAPLVARGAVLRRDAKDARGEQALRMAPTLAPTARGTWTAGLVGRF